MKKELTFAILIGAIFGFTITGLIWLRKEGKLNFNFPRTASEKEEQVAENSETEKTENIEEKNPGEILLEINEPEDEAISQTENLTIKGKSSPQATIVIVWEEGEDILVAEENGSFETEISLIGGENLIQIAAYDDQGNKKETNLTITYSTAQF